MSNASVLITQSITAKSAKPGSARTRLLLEGPIISTLLRLAAPNVVVNVVLIAVTATVDAHFVGQMGSEALAGLSLVFPLIMLMQQMANSSMGGAIASAIARAIGAGRHDDASALVVHGVIVGAGMAVIFAAVLLIGGPVIYGLMGGSGSTRAAAVEYSNAIFAGAFAYWLLSTLTSVVRGAGQAIVLAGFGVAVRLEYLLYPLAFGLGAGVLAMVGTNIGAGKVARAARIAWTGAALAAGITGCIGLFGATLPDIWTSLFTNASDIHVLAAGYLLITGGAYPFLGLGLTLASSFQAAGRPLWPIVGITSRAVIVAVGGWIVVHLTNPGLGGIAVVDASGLIVYGAGLA